MKHTLKEIKKDFNDLKNSNGSYERNIKLIDFKNELEHDYDTFKIYLTAEDLAEVLANNEAVPLYQEILAVRRDQDYFPKTIVLIWVFKDMKVISEISVILLIDMQYLQSAENRKCLFYMR